MSQEFTYAQVSEHSAKKDLYVVIHDKVYNASSFIDEHPGGEEVLLDVGGQDATEAFEDVGHSDEAREILEGLLVGKLKRVAGDPAPSTATANAASGGSGSKANAGSDPFSGIMLYGIVLVGGLVAFFAWRYMQSQEQK